MPNLTTLGRSITKDDAGYVEELLRKIFASLRSSDKNDPVDIIDSYQIALRGLDLNALRQVVLKIIAGTLDAKLRFVPLPPELANYVRTETRLIFNLSRPSSSAPAETIPVVDAMRKRWDGVPILSSGINIDEARSMARKGEVPVGAVYVAILGTYYLPPAGFYGDRRIRPEHGSPVMPADAPDLSDQDAAYLQQILALKDSPDARPETETFKAAATNVVDLYQAENEAHNNRAATSVLPQD